MGEKNRRQLRLNGVQGGRKVGGSRNLMEFGGRRVGGNGDLMGFGGEECRRQLRFNGTQGGRR